MKTILLWDPRFPDRRPARLTVEDAVASAAVRAGVAAAANPAEAGALSAGGALDPTMLTEVVLQHGSGTATRRVFLPYSVVMVGAAAGVLASIGTPIPGGFTPTPTPTTTPTLSPTTATFATNLAAGASVANISGMASSETIRRVSPNDGRLTVNSAGNALLVGRSASATGTKNYTVTTNRGNRLTIAVTATEALSPGSRTYTVTNPNASALTNYQVLMTVPFIAGMAGDFSDLRVFASNGTTLLPMWIESYTAATSAKLWLRVPTVAANGTTDIKLGFGVAGAAGGPDISSVFEFADDFTAASPDTGKWTATSVTANGVARTTLSNVTVQQVFPATIPNSQSGGTGIQSIATDGNFNPATSTSGILAVCYKNSSDTSGIIDLYTITPGASAPVYLRNLTTTGPNHPAGSFFRADNGHLVVSGYNGIKGYDLDAGLVGSWAIAGDTTNFLAKLGCVTQVDGEDPNVVLALSFDENLPSYVIPKYRFAKLRLNTDGTYASLGVWTATMDGTYGAPQGLCTVDGLLYVGVSDLDAPKTEFVRSGYIAQVTLGSGGAVTFGQKIGFPVPFEIEGMQQDPSGRVWVCTQGSPYRLLNNIIFGNDQRLGLVTPGGTGTPETTYLTSVPTFGEGFALGFNGSFSGTFPGFQFSDTAGTPFLSPSNAIGMARVSNSSLQLTPRVILAGAETRQSALTAGMTLRNFEVRRAAGSVAFAVDGAQVGASVSSGLPSGALNIMLGSSTATSTTSGGAVFPRAVYVRKLAAAEPTVSLSAGVGSLSTASTTPTPGVPFSTPISGGSAGSTYTATSSDGVPLSVAGGTLSGTWPTGQNLSGTNPSVTIYETKTNGSVEATTIAFALARLMDPATIPGTPTLVDWVRADTGVTGTTTVTAVASKAGGGTYDGTGHAPSLVVVPSMNNQPALNFGGATAALVGDATIRAATSASPGFSDSVVFQPAASVTASRNLMFNSLAATRTGRNTIYAQATDSLGLAVRSTDGQSASVTTVTPNGTLAASNVYSYLTETNLPAGTTEERLNGAVVMTGACTVATAFPATSSMDAVLGAGTTSSGYTNLFAGNIAERRAFRGILTTPQKQMLEGYDGWRYGITLPAGHPFASYPPTILRLAKLTATRTAAYSSPIAGFPTGATAYTATASDGTALAVSAAGVVSGSFAAAGSVTITLGATYNGVTLSGTSTVTVS